MLKCQEMMNREQETYQTVCTNHKLIGTNSSRQINTNIPQQINFIGKLEDGDVTMIFIAEK